MKVCYFIQSHKDPEQIYRLVRTIKTSSPNSRVLISHDFSTSSLDLALLQKWPEVDVIQRTQSVRRGDFSLVQVYLEAIDWLFEHQRDFDWLLHHSGQDYPTQPLPEIERFLANTPYDGFMRYWDIYSNQLGEPIWTRTESIRRYFYQYAWFPKWTQGFLNKISGIQKFLPIQYYHTFGFMVGMKARSTPFNEKFKCYVSLSWPTLSRKCVQYLRDYLKQHPELVQYYQRTVCPEESLTITVLLNSGLFNVCNDGKVFIDNDSAARTPGGHPRALVAADYDTITDPSFHFARKFDPRQDSEILDLLDARILGEKVSH